MITRKFIHLIFSLMMVASLVGGNLNVSAAPSSPTDESKVPHYFGPYSNYANSSFTLSDATVTINGDGSGATATATVGPNGAVTAITLTDAGSGYTSATVDITGVGSGAIADAVINASGAVTSVSVSAGGAGYTQPSVTFSGGGGAGTLVQVGNPLISRQYATDYATPPGTLGPVLVIVPTTMPVSGQVQSIQYFNQATTGISPTPSAGNLFHAYVLHPTGNPNEYSVLWDSGELTVPPTADPVGVVETIPVPNIAVTTGDTIAFYGEGIPVDVGGGTDILSYPAPIPPVQGTNITVAVGDPTYPVYSQDRTYSFAASVLDASGVVPLVNATATAFGGVDAVILATNGISYTFPTVDFDLPDDPNGVPAKAHAVWDSVTGIISGIVVDSPGSGYASAPDVAILDGTRYQPAAHKPGFQAATATTTLTIQSVKLNTFGSGYIAAPSVLFSDPNVSAAGAMATASVSAGSIASINLTAGGSGYLTTGGIKKFQDGLPKLCIPSANFSECADPTIANNLGQYIPIAVADTTTFSTANGFAADADYFVIALVQHREQMNSSLPAEGTLLREYVQLETPANASWSKHVPLQTALLDGTTTPTLMPDGSQAYAVDDPHYLGPLILATKDKPVRITFYNLLPTGADGNLFLPVDSSFMGSGTGPDSMLNPVDEGTVMDGVRNPLCSEPGLKNPSCFTDNRATLHLHGGITPWISDGTPHQWITPAGENTAYPQGVTVSEVPDMLNVPGVPNCSAQTDGCMSFYYTNQQSARLMFYHDHAWGITRLNVYAGEAAGYLINDETENALIGTGGPLADVGLGIPLVIQDKTFVPSAAQLAQQDPTWDPSRWGGEGSLWYEHVYMPAQNPGDPSGMSAFGRWMYGPWFWPPATPMHGPIANPYYDPNCNLNDPATWQYQTDPFCEPAQIPGTPNNSAGMEQFNDTPVVNGTAYPTTTVDPKAYRFRILNAANDRFWNLQWYVADPTTGTDSEVALKAAEVAAAQTDPNVFPTPDTTLSPAGPSWIQIGTEGGFLPAPVVVPNQPITWITDPTRFDVGNVDKHALLLAPAERADVVVDFSQYAGKTLILYNDAPAAFPARVSSYDYYTGGPDLSPVGAPSTLPGYGPNTRTIMQVKVNAGTPVPFNLTALQNAFKHHADGSGVFESGQHPIIVGQAAYNSAYGTTFTAAGDCTLPTSTNKCDGFARINQQGGDLFTFDSLVGATSGTWSKLSIPLQPKAIHDEMNAAAFDEFGRMTANLGLEAVPATPAAQNIILYPFVNPSTELIDATNLPRGDINVTPISSAADGTQIWKVTHNGVDTHPLHFHLYDVQVLNRVTWDNIIIPPDETELGWKDTVRVSPLEDTYFAIRPIIPAVPFEVPNSIRPLNPMMPLGDTSMFNNIDAAGNPTDPIVNSLVNYGWEYVIHCHILAHEEMDMMRPESVALPPNAPDGLVWAVSGKGNNTVLTLTWNDNSINETAFVVQRDSGAGWVDLATIASPLDQPNTHGVRSYGDTTFKQNTAYQYRVVAKNTIGYGGQFMSLTVQSVSAPVIVGTVGTPPAAPTNLTASVLAGPQASLTWTDNATNETGFIIQRSDNGGPFVQVATAPARSNTGSVTYVDATVVAGNDYVYRVAAANLAGVSAFSNTAAVTLAIPPAAPSNFSALNGPNGKGNQRTVILNWRDNSNNETSFTIQRATNATFTAGLSSIVLAPNTTTFTDTGLSRNTTYFYRIRADNGAVSSVWVVASVTTNP
jgi:FtsP/CotA-like multicopper oxidase with cupredoxin domain